MKLTHALIYCGVWASLMYIGSDIFAGLSWEGYNFSSQAVMLLGGGALTFLQIPRIAANLSTPFFGITERINIYSYMIWIVILAFVLLQNHVTKSKNH